MKPIAMEKIQDHELLRIIGEGHYGEIWLARHSSGAFRALKIIRRDRFQRARPFEREYYGVEKYGPVSRQHDELIDILDIGQNQAEGYFYYAMELGDDQKTGQEIAPESYKTKSLLMELRTRGSLPVGDCLEVGTSMARAVACMHRAGLVHRDIKPANIVYLNGIPRLADIGSVKMLDDSISIAGTEGYMPTEGPGRPTGDIFSLGKVLYEMVTGLECKEFPSMLDTYKDHSSRELKGLRKIILKACAHMPEERYQDAEDMARDLENLANPKSGRLHPALIICILLLLAALIYGLYNVFA